MKTRDIVRILGSNKETLAQPLVILYNGTPFYIKNIGWYLPESEIANVCDYGTSDLLPESKVGVFLQDEPKEIIARALCKALLKNIGAVLQDTPMYFVAPDGTELLVAQIENTTLTLEKS